MPESPVFEVELVAADDDMDELHHVSNLAYVRWVLDVARAHSTDVGFDHDGYRELGAVFVVRRHEIDYLRPAFAGDRIRLSTWIESWKGASALRATRIVRLAGASGPDSEGEIELARARTLWALVSLDTGRPTRIPLALLEAFALRVPAR